MLKLHKFIIAAVLLEENDGEIVAEKTTDPVHIFGLSGLQRFVDDFDGNLAKLNEGE